MSLLLSIDEIEGNTTAITFQQPNGPGPVTTLREKVFCALSTNYPSQIYSPLHSCSFTPKHLSALTINSRQFKHNTNTYERFIAAPIALWFKLKVSKCNSDTNDNFEYVHLVYDPQVEQNRFDLGFRTLAHKIELIHYEITNTNSNT